MEFRSLLLVACFVAAPIFSAGNYLFESIERQGYTQLSPQNFPRLFSKNKSLYYVDSHGFPQPLYKKEDGTILYGENRIWNAKIQKEVDLYYRSNRKKIESNVPPSVPTEVPEPPPLLPAVGVIHTPSILPYQGRPLWMLPNNSKLVLREDLRVPANTTEYGISGSMQIKGNSCKYLCQIVLEKESSFERVLKAGESIRISRAQKWENENEKNIELYISEPAGISKIKCTRISPWWCPNPTLETTEAAMKATWEITKPKPFVEVHRDSRQTGLTSTLHH